MGRIAKKISRETLDAAIQKFNQMPPKAEADALILSDAFLSLKPAISDMQKKGYSLNEILDLLKESGIDVGLTTLKTAVSKPRKKRVSTSKPTATPEQNQAKNNQQKSVQIQVSAVQDPDEK